MITRRGFLGQSLAIAPALAGAAIPAPTPTVPLRIVCVGGHPDDPESGCGGTLARYAALGHVVTIIYLTRGERGIDGKSLVEAARIRTAESEAACRIIGATPIFFGQIDGATEVTARDVNRMTELLMELKPDVIFTHWPVDTHMDHQAASILTIRGWMHSSTPALYFYEVNSGSQTEGFLPNTYVDISAIVERKKSALFAHVSQDGQGIWKEHHEVMARWRGREIGVAAAEGFVHLNRRSPSNDLPRVG